jgi:hypothetical protein
MRIASFTSLVFLPLTGWMLLISPFMLGQSTSTANSPTTLNEYRFNGLAYFPADTFKKPDGSPDEDWADSWAWYLRTRGEPSLLRSTEDLPMEVYRLTVVGFPGAKTWIFRLQIRKDGTGTLFTKLTTFNTTTFLMDDHKVISAADINGFLESVKRAQFWQLPTTKPSEPEMPDGSYWFLERARESEYHMVYRRSPEVNPSAFTDIGRYLSKNLAQLPDSKILIPHSVRPNR